MELNSFAAASPAPGIFHATGSGTQPLPPDELDPRAPRYAITPIWDITGLVSNAFQTGTLPGGKILQLREFQYPVTDANNRNVLRTRTPADQINDFYAVAGDKFGTDFPELAKLQDEAAAERIGSVLVNPNICTKYPFELGNTCTTCWLKYLEAEAPARLLDVCAGNERYFAAAKDSLNRLHGSLSQGLEKARGDINEAKAQVDAGKKVAFVPVDLLNIRHAHQDMPEYKTVTSSEGSIAELGKVLGQALQGGQGGISRDDVLSLIAEANAKKDVRIAELEAQIAKQEQAAAQAEEPVTTEHLAIGDDVTFGDGQIGKVIGKPFGKIQVQTLEGDKLMLEKGDVTKV